MLNTSDIIKYRTILFMCTSLWLVFVLYFNQIYLCCDDTEKAMPRHILSHFVTYCPAFFSNWISHMWHKQQVVCPSSVCPFVRTAKWYLLSKGLLQLSLTCSIFALSLCLSAQFLAQPVSQHHQIFLRQYLPKDLVVMPPRITTL